MTSKIYAPKKVLNGLLYFTLNAKANKILKTILNIIYEVIAS